MRLANRGVRLTWFLERRAGGASLHPSPLPARPGRHPSPVRHPVKAASTLAGKPGATLAARLCSRSPERLRAGSPSHHASTSWSHAIVLDGASARTIAASIDGFRSDQPRDCALHGCFQISIQPPPFMFCNLLRQYTHRISATMERGACSEALA